MYEPESRKAAHAQTTAGAGWLLSWGLQHSHHHLLTPGLLCNSQLLVKFLLTPGLLADPGVKRWYCKGCNTRTTTFWHQDCYATWLTVDAVWETCVHWQIFASWLSDLCTLANICNFANCHIGSCLRDLCTLTDIHFIATSSGAQCLISWGWTELFLYMTSTSLKSSCFCRSGACECW